MKYAKKMKLVEIDNDSSNDKSVIRCEITPSDARYAEPKVLTVLDEAMNEILKENDLNDSDKWTVYNQVLQRYQAFLKNRSDGDAFSIVSNKSENPLELNRSMSDESGVSPFVDTINTISAPSVKSFFERARKNDVTESPLLSPILHNRSLENDLSSSNISIELHPSEIFKESQKPPKLIKKAKARKSLQYPPYTAFPVGKTRLKTMAKRRAADPLSVVKPCKVALIRWEPTNSQ